MILRRMPKLHRIISLNIDLKIENHHRNERLWADRCSILWLDDNRFLMRISILYQIISSKILPKIDEHR